MFPNTHINKYLTASKYTFEVSTQLYFSLK